MGATKTSSNLSLLRNLLRLLVRVIGLLSNGAHIQIRDLWKVCYAGGSVHADHNTLQRR